MRDFLPEDARRREYVISVVKNVFQRYGFEPLETPAAENIETLMGKYGEEGNQLIFKILKRGVHEASGEADLALRYDLTVPLARVVAEYQNKLPKFFKRYQIQPVWRADRPARGRYREFYQCDVDVLGSTSMLVETAYISNPGEEARLSEKISVLTSPDSAPLRTLLEKQLELIAEISARIEKVKDVRNRRIEMLKMLSLHLASLRARLTDNTTEVRLLSDNVRALCDEISQHADGPGDTAPLENSTRTVER